MNFKHKHLIWITPLLVGLSFDRLFWEKPGGINFFLLIVLVILGGLIPFWIEKIHIPWTSYILLVPIFFFAAMTFLRSEPFTIITSVLITFGSMTLFSMTLRNGSWYKFRFRDHFKNFFIFLGNTIIGGVLFFIKVNKKNPLPAEIEKSGISAEATDTASNKEKFINKAAPYLRGILFTLPVLAILTMLLASADPVFSDYVQNLFSWFRIDSLSEYFFRLFYILVLAYLILSVYFFSLFKSQETQVKELEESPLNAILGSIEANILLGSINLLFLSFVILQFTYLFGGRDNINVGNFTYSEYARRGFSELLAVALISLFVFYMLSMITKRETKAKQWTFSSLGLLLVALVTIILISAFTRLTLYEEAYGFTRLRTLTHVFMIWTGLLLAGTAVLDVLKKMDRMAIILICMIFGFGLSINLLNVDQFIVQQNVSRSIPEAGQNNPIPLDTAYLYSLSFDSIPPLVDFFTDSDIPEQLRDDIGGVLACQLATLDHQENQPWSSWHFARSRAINLLEGQSGALAAYPVIEDQGMLFEVEINGEVKSCNDNLTVIANP